MIFVDLRQCVGKRDRGQQILGRCVTGRHEVGPLARAGVFGEGAARRAITAAYRHDDRKAHPDELANLRKLAITAHLHTVTGVRRIAVTENDEWEWTSTVGHIGRRDELALAYAEESSFGRRH